MAVNATLVNELRQKTNAGVMECKKALEQANGDLAKAQEILARAMGEKAAKKADRETKEGLVFSYIHSGGKIGVMLELNCETDFVARNPVFQELAKDIAMQVAAMNPKYLNREAVPADVLAKEQAAQKEEAAKSGKPANVLEKIIAGKLEKWYEGVCLLEQPTIKDDKVKVRDLITNTVAKVGENIGLRRFVRFAIGEALE